MEFSRLSVCKLAMWALTLDGRPAGRVWFSLGRDVSYMRKGEERERGKRGEVEGARDGWCDDELLRGDIIC